MKAFTVEEGRVVAIREDNINTDQIMPSRFLSRIEKAGFGQFVFHNWRFLDSIKGESASELNPDFPLNQPQHQGASILVVGDNFAGGSSREHAVWGLIDYGFRVIIAGSFSDIFYMNSLKNGLLCITLPEDQRQSLADLPADATIQVDLINQVVRTGGATYDFQLDEEWRHKLLHGIDDITQTLQHLEEIDAYEAKWDDFYAYK